MAGQDVMTDEQRDPRRRSANVRTALVLLSIALAFFLGVIAKRMLF